MKLNHAKIGVVVAAVITAGALLASGTGKAVMVPKGELKWKATDIPGIMCAQVSGDMKTGPSRFFLKYPVGLTTPLHSHTADHYVTVISGWISLTAGGKTAKLGPGSYFSLTGKIPHVAKVLGKEPAVFFIEADGPWDVVMAK